MKRIIIKVAVAATIIVATLSLSSNNAAAQVYVGTPEWRAYVDSFGGLKTDDAAVKEERPDGTTMWAVQGQSIGGWKVSLRGVAGSNGKPFYGGTVGLTYEFNKFEVGGEAGLLQMKDYENKPFSGVTFSGTLKVYLGGIHKKTADGETKVRDVVRFYFTAEGGATQQKKAEAALGEGWKYHGNTTSMYAHGGGRVGAEFRGFASPWKFFIEGFARYTQGSSSFKAVDNGVETYNHGKTNNRLFVGASIGISYTFQKKAGFVVSK
jgi:hypothetical protein